MNAAELPIPESDYNHISTATDPFNGLVCIFEHKDVTGEKRFWVEQQRKNNYTDYLTLDEAGAKQQEFVNDAMF